ncbi:MAG: hypothetical protein A2Z16_16110 [Chloroflexi bacterium RBG_16_54_18]|nr:MAG: hypothetical protein A2Z16_16110 [Chloroflexi bacterium RBG_16_54_18]
MSTVNTTPKAAPWIMLIERLLLFLLFQLVVAGLLLLFGSSSPWEDSQGWWLLTVLATNIVTIYLLVRLQQYEGSRYRDLFNFKRSTFWKDLLITLLILIVAIPIASFPNLWLSQLLFGSSEAPFEILFRPIPLWAALLAFLMPLTIAFAELPTYFGYSMPRLGTSLDRPWLAWLISSFALALQHITIPLVLDPLFITYRFGMFLPFALFAGLCIKLRPSLLTYIVVGHALIDLPLVLIVLNMSI